MMFNQDRVLTENEVGRIERSSDVVRRADSSIDWESSFEIDRTNGNGRQGRGKQ